MELKDGSARTKVLVRNTSERVVRRASDRLAVPLLKVALTRLCSWGMR